MWPWALSGDPSRVHAVAQQWAAAAVPLQAAGPRQIVIGATRSATTSTRLITTSTAKTP